MLATLADLALGQSVGINLSLLRVFRVMRIVRVLRKNPELVHLLKAIISSMAGLANLLSFMTLVIIVFAILGMQVRTTTPTYPSPWITCHHGTSAPAGVSRSPQRI